MKILTARPVAGSQRFWGLEHAAGVFLVLGSVANLIGVMMFAVRDGAGGGAPPSPTFFVWERSFILLAVIFNVLGFELLAAYLQPGAGRVLARTGATAYLFAGILLVAAEALSLHVEGAMNDALIVIAVVMSFLAQAAIGGALRQARLLAAWIGWGTMLWNLAWLVILPVVTPGDIYFPILHHLMPLLIGIALLWRTPSTDLC